MSILDDIFQRPAKHLLMRKKYLCSNNQNEKGLNYELALIDLDKRKILLKGVGANVDGEESSIQKQINAFLLGFKYSGIHYTLKVKVMEELDTPKAPTVYYPQKTSTELLKEIENRQNVHRETFFDDDKNFTPLSPNNIEECAINVDFLKKWISG